MKHENESDSILNFWQSIFPNIVESAVDIQDFIKQFPILKLAEQSRNLLAIFKMPHFELDYCTKNTEEVLGISLETFEKNKFYDIVVPEHVKPMMKSLEYAGLYYSALKTKKHITDNMTYRCGLKLNHSKKGSIKIFWRTQIFEMLNNLNNPQRFMIMLQDITHLMKDDFFWFRAEIKDGADTTYFTSRSDTEGCFPNDILSNREKEILICLAEGKSPEEVSKQLFISKVTVNNHRQNMLNKMGVKDLTALIQLSKMMKII